ncbi:MAG: hypothetical protein QM724_13370 [Flavobacteriales bacterium]
MYVADGGFEPPVVPGADIRFDAEGNAFTFPEFLANAVDFIDAWRIGWARSLLRYHPEYGYYLDCIRYSTAPSEPMKRTSDAFDDWLLSIGTFEEAHEAGLITYADEVNDVGVMTQHLTDPAKENADPYAATASGFDGMAEAFSDKVDNYITLWSGLPQERMYSMLEAAALINRCGGAFGSATSSACLAFGESGSAQALLDAEWNTFKALYATEKYAAQKKHADQVALSGCGEAAGVNYCIGRAENDWYEWFQWMYAGTPPGTPWFLGPLYSWCQPCSYAQYHNYTDKVKRFHEPRQVPLSGRSPQYAAYQYYQQTGLCPMAAAWLGMLDQMAVRDQLITEDDAAPINTEGVHLSSIPAYVAVKLAQSDYQPVDPVGNDEMWIGHLANGILTITITGPSSGCEITLNEPNANGFEWDNIIGIPQIHPQGGGDFTYYVYYLVDGIQHSAYATGHMCSEFMLSPCNFPPICQPTQLGFSIQNMMDALAGADLLDHDASPALDLQLALIPGTTTQQTFQDVFVYGGGGAQFLPGGASHLKWSYDATIGALGTFLVDDEPRKIIIEITEVVPSTFDPVTGMGQVHHVTRLSGDHENFFTAHLSDAAGTDLAVIRCAVWWDPGTGVKQPLKPGVCALPPTLACEGTDDDLLGDLFALARERLLNIPVGGNIDLFASPAFTPRINTVLGATLCPQMPRVDEVRTPCTTTSTRTDMGSVGEEGLSRTYTFNDIKCPVFRLELTDEVYDDIRDPRPLLPTDEGGAYHGLVADVYHGSEAVGMLVVEVPCLGFNLCRTCGTDICSVEGYANNYSSELLSVLGENYMRYIREGQSAVGDFFDAPNLSLGGKSFLGQQLCPSCPSGNWHASGTIELGNEEIGTLKYGISSCPVKVVPVLDEADGIGIAVSRADLWLGDWQPIDAMGEDRQHHRYRARLYANGYLLRSYVVAEFSCIYFLYCGIDCQVLDDLLHSAQWVAQQRAIIGEPDGARDVAEIFHAPAMTNRLAYSVSNMIRTGGGSYYREWTSTGSPNCYYSIGSEGVAVMSYGSLGHNISIYIPATMPVIPSGTYLPWVIADAPDIGGDHHVFRCDLPPDGSGNDRAIIVRVDHPFTPCPEIQDVSSKCVDPDNTLLEELSRVVALKIRDNQSDLTAPIDLFGPFWFEPSMSADLRNLIGPLLCPTCTAPDFTTSSSTTISDGNYIISFGCMEVTLPDISGLVPLVGLQASPRGIVFEDGRYIIPLVSRGDLRWNEEKPGQVLTFSIDFRGCGSLPYCCFQDPILRRLRSRSAHTAPDSRRYCC